MAHKTLIGGTAYEITGGKTLVDGTAYSIKSGKTLVGGTAYEVGFGKPVTITIKNTYVGTTSKHGGYVEYSGVQYTDDTSFIANIGDIITCRTWMQQSGSSPDSRITLNGATVAGNDLNSESGEAFYDYVVVADTEIELEHTYSSYYGGGHSGTNVYIVAIQEGNALVNINAGGIAYSSGYNRCYIDGEIAPLIRDSFTLNYEHHAEIKQTSVIKVIAQSDDYGTIAPKISFNGSSVGTKNGNNLEYTFNITDVKIADIIFSYSSKTEEKGGETIRYYAGSISIITT